MGRPAPSNSAKQAFADGGNANYGMMFANKVTVQCP